MVFVYPISFKTPNQTNLTCDTSYSLFSFPFINKFSLELDASNSTPIAMENGTVMTTETLYYGLCFGEKGFREQFME